MSEDFRFHIRIIAQVRSLGWMNESFAAQFIKELLFLEVCKSWYGKDGKGKTNKMMKGLNSFMEFVDSEKKASPDESFKLINKIAINNFSLLQMPPYCTA